MGYTNAGKSTLLNCLTQSDDDALVADRLFATLDPISEPAVDDQAVLAQFPELINVLSQLKEHPQVKSLPLEIDLLSAESVSYQLAGLIPITPIQKQALLEAFDATQRMNILAKLVNKISENST